MTIIVNATAVTYEDADFLVHGSIVHNQHNEAEVEMTGVYLKDSTVDLAEMLSDGVLYELAQLVLDAHGIN